LATFIFYPTIAREIAPPSLSYQPSILAFAFSRIQSDYQARI
jgi:hypothetical protein